MRRVTPPPALAIVLAATLIPTNPMTAHADSGGKTFDGVTVDRSEQEIQVSWNEVAQADEYVIFDEVPKDSVHEDPTQPIYRGANTRHTLSDLPSPSSVRLRIVALDESERVLARSMLRTTTAEDSDSNPQLAEPCSWNIDD